MASIYDLPQFKQFSGQEIRAPYSGANVSGVPGTPSSSNPVVNPNQYSAPIGPQPEKPPSSTVIAGDTARDTAKDTSAKVDTMAAETGGAKKGLTSDEMAKAGITDSTGWTYDSATGTFSPPATTTTGGGWEVDTRPKSPTYGMNIFIPEGQTLDTVKPLPTTDTTETPKTEQQLIDEELQRFQSTLAAVSAMTDPTTQRLLNDINTRYADLVNQQRQINASVEAGQYSSLLSSGAFRGSSAEGIMGLQQQAGLSKIQALVNEQNSLISQALAAKQAGDWEKATDIITKAETKRKDAQDAAVKVKEKLDEENAKKKVVADQAALDKRIADSLAAGESGYVNGATAEMIKKVKDTMSTAGNLGQDLENYKYLLDNGLLPKSITDLPEADKYYAYLKMLDPKKYGASEVSGTKAYKPGANAKDSVEESIIRTRLFSKLMNIINKGQVSDSDAARIESSIATFRDAGMGEQEIMDKLSGFATNVVTPYNKAFVNLIVQNTKDTNIQTDQMGKVSLLLNAGNEIGAMKTVENLSMNNAKQLDPDNYMGQSTAETYLNRISRVRALFKEGGVDVITGTFSNMLGKLKGPQAARIKAELAQLYAQFRKENLGTAVSESEAKFLAPLMTDISDKKANFGEKLDTFERGVMDRYNATRSSVSLPVTKIDEAINANKRLNLYKDSSVETNAQTTIEDLYKNNPDKRGEYENAIGSMTEELGREPTYNELLQAFPELFL